MIANSITRSWTITRNNVNRVFPLLLGYAIDRHDAQTQGSISQLGLLYHQLIQQTRRIDAAIRYWEDLGSTREWIISIVPKYFIKDASWISSAERLRRLDVMLRHRMELLGRLGSILEKLGMLRRDFSVGRSTFELNTILLTTVAMVTRLVSLQRKNITRIVHSPLLTHLIQVSQILFPHEFGNHDETDFLNGKCLRTYCSSGKR
jgi:hypothetical protein